MGLPQLKYNPGLRGDKELIDGFVVRHHHLELVLEVLRENTGASNQHVLIVGPRGSGKTTLVRRVAAEVRENADLAADWYPIVFAEESYLISSPGEFWLETLFHLGEQTQDQRWDRAYQDLRKEPDEDRLRQNALAQLMDFATESGKRVLLIVENMNMLLGEQMKGSGDWDLRHTLLNEPRIMLLGTATSRFEGIERIDKAWFELFAIHELRPLDAEECSALWNAVTGEELRSTRLRPIQILTGGNPRLLRILAEFAAGRSFRELMSQLVHLIDEHTEYFKSHLDNLAAQERKVFVSLLELWDPVSAREVAQVARLGVSKTSSLLSRLVSRGAVQLVDRRGRRKIYQAAERLFNIYYLMRRRGHPSDRVRAAVAFIVQFYQEQELVRATGWLAREAYTLPSDQRQDHYWAYKEIIDRVPRPGLLKAIVEGTPEDFFRSEDVPPQVRALHEQMKFPAEVRSLPHDEPGEAAELTRRGSELLAKSDRPNEAESLYRQAIAIDPMYLRAWAQLGLLLHTKLGRLKEAEEAYRKAIRIDDEYAFAWAQLALLLHEELGRFDEAEDAYRTVIRIGDDSAWAWSQLGLLLHEELGRFDEAEDAYREAIRIDDDYAWAWTRLGLLLHEELERLDEAEEAYREAIRSDDDYAWAWASLGQFLHEQLGRFNEAEEAYREVIRIEDDRAWGWARLGQLLHEELGRFDEAEEACRRAVELEPDYGWACGQLANILASRSRWAELLEIVLPILGDAAVYEEAAEVSTKLLSDLAAAGFAEEALQKLLASEGADALEPLAVGLQIFLGQNPERAQEILEIGQDVAERIRQRQAELA